MKLHQSLVSMNWMKRPIRKVEPYSVGEYLEYKNTMWICISVYIFGYIYYLPA